MTSRRAVLWAMGAGLGTPALRAQSQRSALKLGYLHPRTIAVANNPTLTVLHQWWERMGFVEGESIILRSAEGDLTRVPAILEELGRMGVGAVIVVGGATVRAASRVSRSPPIVAIDLETDPVRAGYAASLGRPGGNITGLFLDQPSLAGKWIDLLREAAPQVERLAIVWDATTGESQLEVARSVCKAKGFDASVLEIGSIRDFDQVLRTLGGRPRTGLVQLTSPGFSLVVERYATAARRHRLPTISFLKAYVRSGILMAYGPVLEDYYQRALVVAERILKGVRPGDLPIEGPSRFELGVNLATAKALDLVLPRSLLLRADEVIE